MLINVMQKKLNFTQILDRVCVCTHTYTRQIYNRTRIIEFPDKLEFFRSFQRKSRALNSTQYT